MFVTAPRPTAASAAAALPLLSNMVTFLRRFLVLAALMFWQGGFTFYAAVVVPVGQQVLGSDLEQGFITRQVTQWLNVAGAVALVPLAWDVLAAERRRRP